MMNAQLMIAEIPLIDWTGPEFLKFYALALLVAWLWSLWNLRQARRRFEPGSKRLPELSDPYEAAFLAGGLRRVRELVVMRLLKLGVVKWDKPSQEGERMVLAESAYSRPMNLTPAETLVVHAVKATGEQGFPVKNLNAVLQGEAMRLERAMAAKGLQPSIREQRESRKLVLWPLIALGILGGIKLAVGLLRDRPVSFLMIALAITWVIGFQISKRMKAPYQTNAGRRLLENLRSQHPVPRVQEDPTSDLGSWTMGAALFGTMALMGDEAFHSPLRWLERTGAEEAERQARAQSAAGGGDSGSSGCSTFTSSCGSSDSGGGSSCSSSSCGSSGCGGCGGGGGD